jgi:AraC-like DNA-binding protein
MAFGQIMGGQSLHKLPGSAPRTMRTFGLYAAVLVTAGRGFYEDAQIARINIRPGSLILVFPELPHRYGPGHEDTWEEYYLTFTGPAFDLLRTTDLICPNQPVLQLEPVEKWLESMRSLRRAGAPPWLETCRLQHWLTEAVASQMDAHRALRSQEERDVRWVAQATALLETDLDKPIDLKHIAHSLGTSYEQFRKRFARLRGIPPARYRAVRIMDQAKMLMQTTSMRDKQIAASLNFCDEFYFSKRFKQIVEHTPRTYRRTIDKT